MLIRPKFVTNSSTSSYIVYGVNVTKDEIHRLLLYLLSKVDVYKFIADNKQYFRELNLLEYDSPEALASDICDEMMGDAPEDWILELSDQRLEAFVDYEGDYDTYIGLESESFDTHVEGNRVVLTDISADDYKFLQEICETLNFNNKDIGFHHWTHYS